MTHAGAVLKRGSTYTLLTTDRCGGQLVVTLGDGVLALMGRDVEARLTDETITLRSGSTSLLINAAGIHLSEQA